MLRYPIYSTVRTLLHLAILVIAIEKLALRWSGVGFLTVHVPVAVPLDWLIYFKPSFSTNLKIKNTSSLQSCVKSVVGGCLTHGTRKIFCSRLTLCKKCA